MDIQPQTTKPISDDQELAKVLAGVSNDAETLDYEETPAVIPDPKPSMDPMPAVQQPADGQPTPTQPEASVTTSPVGNGDLDSIKKDALSELRPLVNKLDLEPEEKFDTYLLLIRSTDDKALIAPAHEAAKAIPDEARRAQALLDIIKEIDFLSTPVQTQ